MTTAKQTATRTAKPKDRRAHVTLQGVLVLTIDGREFCYWIDRIPSDYGMAFDLRKFRAEGGETYHVCIDTDGRGGADSCECKGYLRWGKCKHTAALRALIAAGKLPSYLTR
jgi:hypothetical protein